MTEVLSAVAVLAVVMIGLLSMLQAISPGDALSFVGRAVVMLLLAFLGFYAASTFWTAVLVPWFSTGLAAFKASLSWIAITLVALIALLLAARLLFKEVGRHFTLRFSSQKGHRHDNDHY